jgi:hypothetical protein
VGTPSWKFPHVRCAGILDVVVDDLTAVRAPIVEIDAANGPPSFNEDVQANATGQMVPPQKDTASVCRT